MIMYTMPSVRHCKYIIRDAHHTEFSLLGELTVDVYASLTGKPTVVEQADYYDVLRNVEKRGREPANRIFAAVGDCGELLGTVTFFADLCRYGSGEALSSISNAAGIRYLAVKPESPAERYRQVAYSPLRGSGARVGQIYGDFAHDKCDADGVGDVPTDEF